ncbi:hypothetical protein RN001_014330 [Aquatica leii]|uniref:Uncharacterized protein n=1 Tax=Aquatica leii TaxID=1421715 RepID=A0AAN7Q0N7_9COLE|nr:hypothetical protein RN001_014330 [Aquatica leii]
MLLYTLFIIFVVFNAPFENVLSADTDGYYWRDYIGHVPNDAIEGGRDIQGNPVYVGQAFFKDIGLLPTTIYKGSTNIQVTARGKVFTSNQNIKIFCSKSPDGYRWVPTTIDTMHLLMDCVLLPGGTETNTTLHIGRAYHEMETQIGKIYPRFSEHKGLALPHNGKEANYKSFEVLTYNCSVKQFCEN